MNRYLVEAEYLDPGPLADPEQQTRISNERVLPGQQALADWEAEGRIVAGGVVAGVRRVVFIIEAESNDQLGDLIGRLPIWGINRWKVEPLQTFAARAAQTARHNAAAEAAARGEGHGA
ncbi:MAG: muconolactone Delta-isomerase family protein [Solirubrobacterales bacterium]